MEKICIVHYQGKDSYTPLKDLSEQNITRLRAAKEERVRLGGENYHREQCEMIPDVITEAHGIHSEPCYKKFTLILSKKKQSKDQLSGKRVSLRQSCSSTTQSLVYPKECKFCGKNKIQYNSKSVYPITVATKQAENTIKTVAETANPTLYTEIKDLDLIAKEFRYHRPCYQNFTRITKEKESSAIYDKGNFEAVIQCIKERVLTNHQVVSMKILHQIYGLEPDDTRYRNHLKKRLQGNFGNQLSFLTVKQNSAEVVINASIVTDQKDFIFDSDIEKVAERLRHEILEYSKCLPEPNWPPTISELSTGDRGPPQLLLTFLNSLLRTEKHVVSRSDKISRMVESYAADLVHGVTRGNVLTAKHFLLALGLHSLTGKKKIVEILYGLGHCISYNRVCEIETAQAQAALMKSEETSCLSLKPLTDNDQVLTFFWVDNFDCIVETQSGGGSINSTHLMAFQEETVGSTPNKVDITLEKSRTRTLVTTDNLEQLNVVIDAKKEPPSINSVQNFKPKDTNNFFSKILTWLILRKLNSFDQQIPSFSGWLLNNRIQASGCDSIKKTVETYLPPIASKVTDFNTIHQYLKYLQSLAESVNMPYVNITLDVGAAINAFKVVWNLSDVFQNVVIHLGDFHFMKENFKVMGKIITGSGFEDIVYHADICTSGSLNGVINGSHYNRCWHVHNILSEALERILITRFIVESNKGIPDALVEVSHDPRMFSYSQMKTYESFTQSYEHYFQDVLNGRIGKTATFWAQYLEMMRFQKMIHLAVQENNFQLRLQAWEYWIPLYFATDMFNYARYGSYYVETLNTIDDRYPGLKDMMLNSAISVQGQDRYPHRTAIDQRGEQTINRDAKTSGGVKYFASSHDAVQKWCMNRPLQAENVNALERIAGITKGNTLYKHLRPSQILRSESLVSKVIDILETEYINPFGSIDESKLYVLSSGVPLEDDIADQIIEVQFAGKQLADNFKEERIRRRAKKFHDPITKTKKKCFKQAVGKSLIVRKGNMAKTVDVNRSILGSLMSFSLKNEKAIDIEKALQYPLSPIPLSIANADGSRRQTSKSKLMQVFESRMSSDPSNWYSNPPKTGVAAYVVDFIALVRTVVEVPNTFEELGWKLLKMIPSGYPRVDFVSDTYRLVSIKNAERAKRGLSSQIIIKSVKSKIPRDFKAFMSNGENKNRMVSLLFEFYSVNRVKVLNTLRSSHFVLSGENKTTSFTLSRISDEDDLKSNQEEADTKVVLHCRNALESYPLSSVILRSHSGDTDITVISISLLKEFKERVFLDCGCGKIRKGFWLSSIEMSESEKNALIPFHAFTGNDFVSSFFRKGKPLCWKIMKQQERLEKAFHQLGETWEVSEESFELLEEFVCALYGSKKKNVNELRSEIFFKKYTNQNKIVDLSVLPPCQTILRLHCRRANYVAKIWKSSLQAYVDVPDMSLHGWSTHGHSEWIDIAFPESIEEILLDPNFSGEFEMDSDVDSGEES